ncbi:amino acid ABC transporter permease [Veronia pacifica]|uniref:Polar amino acid ABC transporter permease n=1 Tax=Veronia pacifica TaxID=1080227 RepID=A0A1C3E739_9GAMM|nr:amino acid ABC transporter permease [Veronia pacifica]ODA29033.1 polar amino acid ABC transporter permease [Veronia pacifica]
MMREKPAGIFVSWSIYLTIMFGLAYLILDGASAMGYNWQWYRIPPYFFSIKDGSLELGQFTIGVLYTLKISFVAFFIACVVAGILVALRLSHLVVGRALSITILELVRNTPILVLLYLFYYVFGPVFSMERDVAGIACLAAFHGVLISEILRSSIQAIPSGQWEGAKSIGMSPLQTYRYIILPQTVSYVIPPLTGELIHLIKNSAVVSVIAVVELTTIGRNVISDTYMSFEVWFTIAAIYLVITLSFSAVFHVVEKRFVFRR